MAVEMLDRRRMPPSYFLDADPEHSGYLLALVRTRRPAAQDDRSDTTFVQAAAIGQCGDVDRSFATEFGKGSRHIREDERTKVCRTILLNHPFSSLRFRAIGGRFDGSYLLLNCNGCSRGL